MKNMNTVEELTNMRRGYEMLIAEAAALAELGDQSADLVEQVAHLRLQHAAIERAIVRGGPVVLKS